MKQFDVIRENKALFGSDVLLRGIFSFRAISPRGESALFQKWIVLDARHRALSRA